MSLPVGDWQFWVVTLAMGIAVVFIARSVWPRRKKSRRTEITVRGKRI